MKESGLWRKHITVTNCFSDTIDSGSRNQKCPFGSTLVLVGCEPLDGPRLQQYVDQRLRLWNPMKNHGSNFATSDFNWRLLTYLCLRAWSAASRLMARGCSNMLASDSAKGISRSRAHTDPSVWPWIYRIEGLVYYCGLSWCSHQTKPRRCLWKDTWSVMIQWVVWPQLVFRYKAARLSPASVYEKNKTVWV